MTDKRNAGHPGTAISRRGLLKSVGLATAAISATNLAADNSHGNADAGAYVYVGSYTGKGMGIYVFQLQPFSGALKPVGIALGVSNPSFLALHPNKQFLYCCDENNQGTLTAFPINPLTRLLTSSNMPP